jgi:hypothetical protein
MANFNRRSVFLSVNDGNQLQQAMQTTLAELLRHSPPCISSGIKKLDRILPDGGYMPGIYDISASSAPVGLGVYELLFHAMLSSLEHGGNVLVVESRGNRVPWMKLTKHARFREEFRDRVKSLEVASLTELIVLFESSELLHGLDVVILDAFANLYASELHGIQDIIGNSGDGKEGIVRFYQAVKCLFAMIQQRCQRGMVVFTVGSMGEFNQKVVVQEQDPEVEAADDGEIDIDLDGIGEMSSAEVTRTKYINQQILVPTISLKSDINMYYNARIIVYRDWVHESCVNGECGLVSGLDEKNPRVFEDAVRMLNEGGIRCLPHYLCIIPYPRSDERKVSSSGFFLIDNNFQVIDIDNVVDNDDGGEAQTQDTDFGDMQENHDDNCNEDEDIDDIVIPDSQAW